MDILLCYANFNTILKQSLKYLSMENIMVRMALNKGINAKIQSAKKLSMIFLNPQFQVVKRD